MSPPISASHVQASASAQSALEQLAIEQERSGELAARVQELAAAQEAAAARFRDAQEELELERTRNSSLLVCGALCVPWPGHSD